MNAMSRLDLESKPEGTNMPAARNAARIELFTGYEPEGTRDRIR